MDYVAQYLNILNTNARYESAFSHYVFTAEKGKKYTRIVSETVWHSNGDRSGRSSHAFINHETGEIFKSESWKKPAKGVRYSLPQDADTLCQRVDPYGSYLYMNR